MDTNRTASSPDALPAARRNLSRRRLLRHAGGIGLAATGTLAIGTAVAFPNTSGGPETTRLLHDEHATPPGPATPQVGEREDGTHLWHVRVGGMDMENLIDVQAFLPTELTINAGDAVWFEFGQMPGFHTVSFPSGAEPPALLIPDPDAATPAPDEPPTLMINPELIFPTEGDSYDGTGFVNSGVDVFREPTAPPFVLTFTEPGTYEYLCLPHGAVMSGTITVQETGADLPHDQAAYDQMAEEQFAALIEEGLAATEEYSEAVATERADGTTLWEVAAGVGEGQARVFRMMPDTIEIGVGDTIRWVNHSPGEPHTVTFVAGEEPPEDVLVEPQPNGPPKLIQNNLTLLQQGDDVFSGTGYFNSGFMGEEFVGIGFYELTFDTPGEFDYYCMLHGGADGTGMSATVIVTDDA